jgi:hypothetical protein
MLKKLTNKNLSLRKKILEERIAKACYNVCGAECAMDPKNDSVTLNFIVRDIIM